MNFREAIEYIEKNRQKTVIGLDRKLKEIFVIDFHFYDEDEIEEGDEEDGYLHMHYEKDLGESSGEEESYDLWAELEECLENHPELEAIDFFDVEPKKLDNIYGMEFAYQLEKINKILNFK